MSTATQERHKSVAVDVAGVKVGGGAPIVVQSMTNTDTADVEGTARQVAALHRAGSELVRITVDRDEAAAAVPRIKERLLKMGVNVPIVVRMEGTNVEEGKRILRESGLKFSTADSMGEAAEKVVAQASAARANACTVSSTKT